jgi:NAD(P)-dependent dehydrogenase (short-subunit alcohol dehydrogenase family)
MTNALRQKPHPRGTIVTGLHVGYMDTDMTVGVKGPKSDPALSRASPSDGIEAGEFEILADEVRRSVRSGLAGRVAALCPSLEGSSSR